MDISNIALDRFLCKHRIAEGKGNIVSLPEEKKELSIEEELLLDYKDNPDAIEFLTLLRKQSPRYVYPQCNRLRRMQKYYSDEQMDVGFLHCLNAGDCSVLELTAFLIYKYGEETAKKFITPHTMRHYKERAEKIREGQFNG